jgi:hypothetical protein
MERQLTVEDARQSLRGHVSAKGEEIRAKYGPHIGWNELRLILQDRECVRYPCEISFDSVPLMEDEFAYAQAKSEHPEDGFVMHVHPYFATQPERVPYLVFYHLVTVNYGEFASAEDAEAFGASALGLSQDDYYRTLCQMADEIG